MAASAGPRIWSTFASTGRSSQLPRVSSDMRSFPVRATHSANREKCVRSVRLNFRSRPPIAFAVASAGGKVVFGRERTGVLPMTNAASPAPPADQPVLDTTVYGRGVKRQGHRRDRGRGDHASCRDRRRRDDRLHRRAGHLVAVDPSSSKPNAKFFYVGFTADGANPNTRPVTFFYNGGPGSSAVFLLLGSFAPRRIHTNMPGFTPPPPYSMEDNPDSLIDRTDLVYINPIWNRLFRRHRAGEKPRFLGSRSGRALDQAVHQALSDRLGRLGTRQNSCSANPLAPRAPACSPGCCMRTASSSTASRSSRACSITRQPSPTPSVSYRPLRPTPGITTRRA